jgi:hypothetical protein
MGKWAIRGGEKKNQAVFLILLAIRTQYKLI